MAQLVRFKLQEYFRTRASVAYIVEAATNGFGAPPRWRAKNASTMAK
jgi:hypothetical protein